jgi:acyl-CoA thioesterase-1
MSSTQAAEAFVLVKEEALPLRYRPLMGQPVEVRSHSSNTHADRIEYEEGKDYIIDYEYGRIRRTQGSRIPDGSLHPMYKVDKFDHTQYPEYSNVTYTVYADYITESVFAKEERLTVAEAKKSGFLNRTIRKLSAGEEVLYVVYGDSISAGGEASQESLTYYGLFTALLRDLYPVGRIRIENRSIPGETSEGGASRVYEDVIPLEPDLVSIGYGMNDQNIHGNGITLEQFEKNLRHILDTLRSFSESDILLVTPCEPNPHWQHTSGQTHRYADSIRRLGDEYGIGVADAHTLWCQELAAGKTPESLLLNNINHPNDYGHWIYSQAFTPMLRGKL